LDFTNRRFGILSFYFSLKLEKIKIPEKEIEEVSVADPDPGSCAFLTSGSGWIKKIKIRIRDPNPR
jgi:hypothetical protein